MSQESIETVQVFLHAKDAPDESQKERFLDFVRRTYNKEGELHFVYDESLARGFILKVGSDVYDWSTKGRIRLFEQEVLRVTKHKDKVIPLIHEIIDDWSLDVIPEEVGTVETVGDGIVTMSGLNHVRYGEIVLFENGMRGMVQDIRRDNIGCILFGDEGDIREGSTVRRTGKTAGIPVSGKYLSRVVNALGEPIDGQGEIEPEDYYEIERKAPGIVDRQPVKQPMETGLICIDSMFPIGRGQRELIIGDRQTGKTTIAVDTILNQKGKDVICIYVAIGQKASSVAQLVNNLKKNGAMDYTVVMCASASDSMPLQYIAPYAGCALGEYFMHQGKDVLIIYDDLSKHAIAYRAISLLLERSPGREAYPGDVFYLHSRLLERSAHLSDEHGGGSMTALPIVETQAGDVSAYIPTNIISITDGQIFLESNLFFSGQRPAVNVGLSVSRVGGDAQTKAMKKAAGTIRLELAQYREMEVFTQFSSDMDEITANQLKYGQGLMQLLKQPQNHPYKQHEQVILLVSALNHLFQNVEVNEVREKASMLLKHFHENAPELCASIDRDGMLSDERKSEILQIATAYLN